MAVERFTVMNPDRKTYRVPGIRCMDFRIESSTGYATYFADFVNRLGAYEELGTVEEIRELKSTYAKR